MNNATGKVKTEIADQRIPALDGVRGFMTIVVMISHYFGEVQHGFQALMGGWIAVTMFYVLSGFLIARLILQKGEHANFFKVFYIRRVCRTFPIYFVCVALISAITGLWHFHESYENMHFPLTAYLTFTQNFWMANTGSIGEQWLSPTWTLALEEQFYILAPALILLVPRQHLLKLLVTMMGFAVMARIWVLDFSSLNAFAAAVLLPTKLDVLVAGVLAAVLLRQNWINWSKLDEFLRILPIPLLLLTTVLKLVAGENGKLFLIFGPFLISSACAAFLMSLVRGAPEAKRFQGKIFGFFCNISYAVYLTHLLVLGLMHNLLLGTAPDVANSTQILVTIAAMPVTVGLSYVLTKFVEAPITNFGRSFKWSKEMRAPRKPMLQAVSN
ncbi:MAG: acyltransferase [Aestuariivirga sp.]